jgi:hypothetical protein
MNNKQRRGDLFILNPDSDSVEKNIRKRIGNLWAHLESRPPVDHSFALNHLAHAEKASQFFAAVSPEAKLPKQENSLQTILEPFYSWHEWKWHLPQASVPLAALFTESATARGVRNRKAIVREMEIACVDTLRVESINLLSIGGGTTPALREMMELVVSGGHVIILDWDVVPEANLAWVEYLPAVWQYEVRCTDPQHPENAIAGNWRPHLVEAVGLTDCTPDEMMISILDYIHKVIPAGGWLIAGSVDPNTTERQYLHQMFDRPEIIHRSQQDLQQLLARAGFDIDHMVSVQEPCGVCNVVAITK